MKTARLGPTTNVPGYNEITDTILMPVLYPNSWQYTCPTVLAGANSKGTTTVMVAKVATLDGA